MKLFIGSFLVFTALLISACAVNRIPNNEAYRNKTGNKPDQLKIKELACRSPNQRYTVSRYPAFRLIQPANHPNRFYAHQHQKRKNNITVVNNRRHLPDMANRQVMLPDRSVQVLPPVFSPEVDSLVALKADHFTLAGILKPGIPTQTRLSTLSVSVKPANRDELNPGPSKHRTFSFREGMIYLSTLFAMFLSFIGLKNASRLADKISYWAALNPGKTRALIGGIQISTGFAGLILGNEMANNGIVCSDLSRNLILGTFLGAALLYPVRKSRVKILRRTYLRQKVHDLLLFLSGFLMMVYAGNHTSLTKPDLNPVNYPAVSPQSYTYHAFHSSTTPDRTVSYAKETKLQDETTQPAKHGLRTGEKIALTTLVILAFCAAAFGIIAASCSLACSGLNTLAVLVAVVGGILIIWLAYLALKGIYHPKNRQNLQPSAAG